MLHILASLFIVAAGHHFTCTPTRVWDGDGPIWCGEGMKIRLAGVAAREIDGSCRAWQPCPTASGVAARDRLVELLGGARGTTSDGHILVSGPRLSCLSEGRAKGTRTGAWCTSPETGDLSCAMIASGLALRWRTFDPDNKCRRR
jgi:endonuclease YncB( thermonuclease family)